MIQLHDKQFVPFISSEEIDFAIATMASQVEADFADEIPVFIGVLNGFKSMLVLFYRLRFRHVQYA